MDEPTKKPRPTTRYKKKESNPLGAGRKPKPLDWDIARNLCEAHCTQAEVAAKLNINISTLKDRCIQEQGIEFAQFYKQWKDVGNSSLRAVQYAKAIKGDNQLLIWLGKNRLNQVDRQEIQVNVRPFVIENPSGNELTNLGVDEMPVLEGETIDPESIAVSEETYYSNETIDDKEDIDEFATSQSDE